jgi:hypothetical protein
MTHDVAVYDPRDGTVLETLTDEPTGLLAHVALELKHREQRFKDMRVLVEAELVTRVQDANRKVVLIDGLELKIESGRGRVWDGNDLEHACRQLVDDGTVSAGELTGLITHETKVDGKAAQRLLGLLHGPALSLVEGCFRWEQRGRPRLTITPSLALIPEENDPS